MKGLTWEVEYVDFYSDPSCGYPYNVYFEAKARGIVEDPKCLRNKEVGDVHQDLQAILLGVNADPPLKITHVIFNNPATIVFWSDKTKTVVRCQNGDMYDPEKGLSMAITKKFLGNHFDYFDELRKWLIRQDIGTYILDKEVKHDS